MSEDTKIIISNIKEDIRRKAKDFNDKMLYEHEEICNDILQIIDKHICAN